MCEYLTPISRLYKMHCLRSLTLSDIASRANTFYQDYESKKDNIYKAIQYYYILDNYHLYFKPGLIMFRFDFIIKRSILINITQINILN
jgi:hypothetical protein